METNSVVCVDSHAHVPIRVSPIPRDKLTSVLDGFEATTTVADWKSYKCKRVVRNALAGETQAYVETLDMLKFTQMFYALFLDPWKSLSDVESIFEKQHKGPVITDAKSLYDALERSESSTRNLTERRTAIEVTAIRQRLDYGFIYTGWVNSDRQMADGLTKPWKSLEIMSLGKWKIVWDATFQSARKLKVGGRSEGKRDFDG